MLSVVFPKAVYCGSYYLSFTSWMFLLFFTGSSVTVKLYADDAKFDFCIQCADYMHSLQLGLDFVHNWSIAWQLSQSATKCTVLQLDRSLVTGTRNSVYLLWLLMICFVGPLQHGSHFVYSAHERINCEIVCQTNFRVRRRSEFFSVRVINARKNLEF